MSVVIYMHARFIVRFNVGVREGQQLAEEEMLRNGQFR